jgi:hypothetical protein
MKWVAGVQVKILKTEENVLEEKQLLEVELLEIVSLLLILLVEKTSLTYFGTNESRKWRLKRKKRALTTAKRRQVHRNHIRYRRCLGKNIQENNMEYKDQN